MYTGMEYGPEIIPAQHQVSTSFNISFIPTYLPTYLIPGKNQPWGPLSVQYKDKADMKVSILIQY
jgi:hypothetical protein